MSVAAPSAISPVRRLLGATANYGLGGFLPQVVGFLLIPLYTAVLTPADYGTIDAAVVLGGLMGVLMRLGVPGAVTRFYYDHPSGQGLADYVTTVFVGVTGLGLLVAMLAAATAPWWSPTVAPALPMWGLGLVLVTSVASLWSDLQRRLLQAREQSRYTAVLNLVAALAGIAVTIALVLGLGLGVFGMLLAQAVVAIALAVQAVGYLRADLGGRFRGELLRASVVYGTGMLPTHVIAAAAPVVARALLAGADSVAAVGVFAIATRFASPLLLFGNAFNSAFLPIYFSMRKEEDAAAPARIARLMRGAWLAATLLALGASTVGPPVVVWMTPEPFHAAAPLLPVLALGFMGQMAYWLFSAEMFFAKRTRLSVGMWGPAVAANLLLTAALTPTLGALGAAAGAAAGSVLSGAIAAGLSARLVALPHRWAGLAVPPALAIGLWASIAAAPLPAPARAAAGVAACALLPALLWLAGDEGVLELVARVRQRLARSRAP